MTRILTLFYLILFLGVCLTSLYVVYHILRYSLSKRQAIVIGVAFVSVLVLLLITNAVLFFRIDWDGLLADAGGFTYVPRSSTGY